MNSSAPTGTVRGQTGSNPLSYGRIQALSWRQVFDAIGRILIPCFLPKCNDQPGLFAIIHLRNIPTKQDYTGVVTAGACHLSSVYRHGPTVEAGKYQIVFEDQWSTAR